MRLLFWVAVLFGGAVGLALFTQFNHSNVVLFYPPYRVEMSLNLALALLLLAFFVIWTIMSTARHLSEMPRRAAAYRERSRMGKAQAALRESSKTCSRAALPVPNAPRRKPRPGPSRPRPPRWLARAPRIGCRSPTAATRGWRR